MSAGTPPGISVGPAGVRAYLHLGKLYREAPHVPAPRPGKAKRVSARQIREMADAVIAGARANRIRDADAKHELQTLDAAMSYALKRAPVVAEIHEDQAPVSNPARDARRRKRRAVKAARRRNRR